ncbi:MAG: hypothetical protein AAFZ18_39685 [Myxococcota bacterium]
MSTLVDYYEQQSDSASFRDLEDREARKGRRPDAGFHFRSMRAREQAS